MRIKNYFFCSGCVLCFLSLAAGLFFCTPHKDTLTDRQIREFAAVYADYLAAIASDTVDIKTSGVKLQQLLDRAGMTREDFYGYKEKLEQDPAAFKKMIEIVNNTLQTASDPTK